MSHSDGRWYVDGHYVKVLKPEREFLNEGAPETICEMQSSVSPEETTANQRLIVASPKLLEAAEALLANLIDTEAFGPDEEIDPDDWDGPLDEDGAPWYWDVWNLREAIEQAKGGEV